MRSLRVLLGILLATACAEGGPPDAGFPTFWSEFQAAVAADDAAAVGQFTRFPFLFEGEQSDSSEFLAIYTALFDAPARGCLTGTTPLAEDGRYLAFCGPIVYVFERGEHGWRFAEFTADPEAWEEGEPHPGEDSAAALGRWQFLDGRTAPWAGGAPAHLAGAELTSTGLEIAVGQVLAVHPLGCGHAEYEFVLTPPEGLFQGNLPDPAPAAARGLGIGRNRALTLRVSCDSGVFDYHHLPGDTLLLGLDGMVWRLAPETRASTPASAVRALLAEHMTADMAFTSTALAPKRRFLSDPLADRISHYFAQPQPADEPPPINGDPFTDSQEHPDRFTIGTIDRDSEYARVRIVFSDGIRTRPVDFLLVQSGESWLLHDIRYEDGATLRDLLEE